ncbi:MAG: nicotinate-nicotinamide nucleotide adenylyltransferase [Myxococcota bacterium]
MILFGLSANPPTGLGGHAGLVRWAADQARLDEWGGEGADEVWILPVYRHAFTAKRHMAPFEDRVAMARLAFEQLAGLEGRVRVLRLEKHVYESLKSAGAPDSTPNVGTIDVIDHLEQTVPGCRFALLLGADTYRDLLEGKWRRSDELLRRVVIIAVARKGVSVEVPVRSDAPMLDEISSSAIRRDFSAWAHTLQPEVRRYIETHGLYLSPD